MNNNLLFITRDLPSAIHKDGTSVVLYNLIKRLDDYKISIVYFGKKNLKNEEFYTAFKITVIHNPLICNKNSYCEIINGRLFIKPRNVWNFKYSDYTIYEGSKFDIIYFIGFDSSFLIQLYKKLKKTKLIFFEIDSLSLYYERSYRNSNNFIKSFYYFTQYLFIKLHEKYFYNLVSKVLFVSNVDEKYSQSMFPEIPRTKFANIKIGVESTDRTKVNKIPDKKINICFTGIFDYQPNNEAALFIVKKIIPLFIEKNNDTVFHLIGPNLTQEISSSSYAYRKNIVFTGFVENLDLYLSEMDLFISPLFIGSGMKNKILKAMDIGLPIVCTSLSIDGIDEMRNKESCIICDSINEIDWVDSIEMILNDKVQMSRFSKLTRNITKKNYNWDVITKQFINVTK